VEHVLIVIWKSMNFVWMVKLMSIVSLSNWDGLTLALKKICLMPSFIVLSQIYRMFNFCTGTKIMSLCQFVAFNFRMFSLLHCYKNHPYQYSAIFWRSFGLRWRSFSDLLAIFIIKFGDLFACSSDLLVFFWSFRLVGMSLCHILSHWSFNFWWISFSS